MLGITDISRCFLPAIKHGGYFSYFPKQTNRRIQQECFTHVVLTHFPEFIECVTFNAKTFIISFNISTSNSLNMDN